jgi:Flp pilus assembly protein TadG
MACYRKGPRKSRRRRRGVAVVELAITLPLLGVLVLGITEFSQLMGASQVVSNASRRGARLAARNDTVTASEVQSDVRAFLTGALPSLSGSSGSSAISVQVVNGSGTSITGGNLTTISSGSPIRVDVSLNFDSIRWLSHFSTLNSQVLQTSTVARRE